MRNLIHGPLKIQIDATFAKQQIQLSTIYTNIETVNLSGIDQLNRKECEILFGTPNATSEYLKQYKQQDMLEESYKSVRL